MDVTVLDVGPATETDGLGCDLVRESSVDTEAAFGVDIMTGSFSTP